MAVDRWLEHARRALAPLGTAGLSKVELAKVGLARVGEQARMLIDPRESTLEGLARVAPGEPTPGGDPLDEGFELALRLTAALLGYGLPVYRLEQAFSRLSRALGYESSVYVTPTGLIATFGSGATSRAKVVTAEPGTADLGRLAALQALVGLVERHEIGPRAALVQLDRVLARPPRYSSRAGVLATGVLAGTASVLLAAPAEEAALVLAIGLVVGLLRASSESERFAALGRLLPAACALVATTIALTARAFGLPVDPTRALLASCIVTLPGLSVTIGMLELATANLVSGTARLMGAGLTFLQLGFGAVIAQTFAKSAVVAAAFDGSHALVAPTTLPELARVAAPFFSAGCFAVTYQVRGRDVLWVLLASVGSALIARLGGAEFGPEVSAFLAATAVTTTSHAFTRVTARPALTLLVPGVLMIVPGSVGFLSLSSLLESDPVAGIQTGFDMLFIAMSIAAGMLVGTMLVPPRATDL